MFMAPLPCPYEIAHSFGLLAYQLCLQSQPLPDKTLLILLIAVGNWTRLSSLAVMGGGEVTGAIFPTSEGGRFLEEAL